MQEANEEANEDVKEQRQDLARENSVVEREKNATGIDQGNSKLQDSFAFKRNARLIHEISAIKMQD